MSEVNTITDDQELTTAVSMWLFENDLAHHWEIRTYRESVRMGREAVPGVVLSHCPGGDMGSRIVITAQADRTLEEVYAMARAALTAWKGIHCP